MLRDMTEPSGAAAPSQPVDRNFMSLEGKVRHPVGLVCAGDRWGHNVYNKTRLKGYQKSPMGWMFLIWLTRIEMRAWHGNPDYELCFKENSICWADELSTVVWTISYTIFSKHRSGTKFWFLISQESTAWGWRWLLVKWKPLESQSHPKSIRVMFPSFHQHIAEKKIKLGRFACNHLAFWTKASPDLHEQVLCSHIWPRTLYVLDVATNLGPLMSMDMVAGFTRSVNPWIPRAGWQAGT